MNKRVNGIEVCEVSDPAELKAAADRRAQFDLNSEWLQKHITDIYSRYRGQNICIAGQEVFAAPTATEAINQARSAHPDDQGWFTRYIPNQKVDRIYAV